MPKFLYHPLALDPVDKGKSKRKIRVSGRLVNMTPLIANGFQSVLNFEWILING
jgi:hypothetical protein